MEPLKEIFNEAYYKQLSIVLKSVYPGFNSKEFTKTVVKDLAERSLNERLRNTSLVLRDFLPKQLDQSIGIFHAAAPKLPTGYSALVFPDYIGLYGLPHFEKSMQSLKYLTTFGSAEFAVREFLKHDFAKALGIMEKWTSEKDPHVRRLASEGTRPRLPWSFKLDAVIEKPERTTKLLKQLNADSSLYVRKSVANHLNDISKDHPDYMIQLVSKWNLENQHTAWIVKHASRTLIKKGDSKILSLFQFEAAPKVRCENLQLSHSNLKLGDVLQFSFDLVSEKKKEQRLVIDYKVHYAKQKGSTAKVFKLKEVVLPAGKIMRIEKRQLFQDFSTRTHYAGEHAIELLANGKSIGKALFYLQKK